MPGSAPATTTTKEIQRRLVKPSEFLPIQKGAQDTGQQNNKQEIAMSEQTEWQKWCKETAPVMAAAGRGEEVEVFAGGRWLDKEGGLFYSGAEYRIKPRTIRIGEYDVPEPMRDAPVVDSIYYLPVLDGSDNRAVVWGDDEYDRKWLQLGLCHKTREAAELHAMALVSLTAKKV